MASINANQGNGRKWLVAVDGSPNGESAFNFTLARIDTKVDHLLLMAVADRVDPYIYARSFVSMSFLREAQESLERSVKSTLRKYAEKAHQAGVQHVHLMMSTSDSPGDMICHAAAVKEVDTIVVGRRGLGKLKRLMLGSISRFVLEHAPCDVMCVKGDYGPEEEHEVTKAEVKRAEEIERYRRIQEEKQEREEAEKMAAFESDLDRNIARYAEEKEKLRRMQEAEDAKKEDEEDRAAANVGSIVDEEHERERRIKEDQVVDERVHHVEIFSRDE